MATLLTWHVVGLRLLSLVVAQALVALGLWLAGDREPWWSSASWWPWSLTLANALALGWLWRARMLLDPALTDPTSSRPDAHAALRILPLLLCASAAPLVLAYALWPDPTVGRWLLSGADPPLHGWLALIVAPVSSALLELSLLRWLLHRGRGAHALRVVGLALAFGAQHALHPFAPAMEFFLWRSLMGLPLGLFYAITLARRPGLLPYWIFAHSLLLGLAGAWVIAR